MKDWFPGKARLVESSTPAIGTSFDEPCLELAYGRMDEIVSRLEQPDAGQPLAGDALL